MSNLFCSCYTTANYPQRYQPQHSPSVLAYATFNVVEANESGWYSGSAAASHMTPNKGSLLVKIPYHGSYRVRVGNGTLLTIQ